MNTNTVTFVHCTDLYSADQIRRVEREFNLTTGLLILDKATVDVFLTPDPEKVSDDVKVGFYGRGR